VAVFVEEQIRGFTKAGNIGCAEEENLLLMKLPSDARVYVNFHCTFAPGRTACLLYSLGRAFTLPQRSSV
jgi:hypothetical protein